LCWCFLLFKLLFDRLRAFRLAKVLRQSFVGLWVAMGCWSVGVGVCVCVCVCVCMCFLAAWVQKGSQNKPDGSIVKAVSTHFGPGGHQRGSYNQKKNRNLQKIANTKMDNCKHVMFQMRRRFYQNMDGQTAAGLPLFF